MQQHHLRRLLRLAKKTGDAIVIADSEGGEPMVLMSLDRYETMLDLCLTNEEEAEEYEEIDEENTSLRNEEYSAPPVLEDVFEPAPHKQPLQRVEKPLPQAQKTRQELPDYGGEERFYLEPLE